MQLNIQICVKHKHSQEMIHLNLYMTYILKLMFRKIKFPFPPVLTIKHP